MPIRPENAARYPKDWKKVVVPRIRARSGNRCECTGQCGIDHLDYTAPIATRAIRCDRLNGTPIGKADGPKIVLTVAHLDHTPENCADENLLHLCQKCHNRYDAPTRAAGIKERKRAAMAVGDLLSGN